MIETEAIDHTLSVIVRNQVAIEVNTSGNEKGCGWYSADNILERTLFYWGDVTFGSDAHVPERVWDPYTTIHQISGFLGKARITRGRTCLVV